MAFCLTATSPSPFSLLPTSPQAKLAISAFPWDTKTPRPKMNKQRKTRSARSPACPTRQTNFESGGFHMLEVHESTATFTVVLILTILCLCVVAWKLWRYGSKGRGFKFLASQRTWPPRQDMELPVDNWAHRIPWRPPGLHHWLPHNGPAPASRGLPFGPLRLQRPPQRPRTGP